MSDDPMDRLRGIEQARASAEMRSLLQRATETAERMADLAASAVRDLAASNRERDNMRTERDMAYLRTDELANEVQSLRLRLAQYETATQPPAIA